MKSHFTSCFCERKKEIIQFGKQLVSGEDLQMLSDLNFHIGVNICKEDPDAEGVEIG